MRDILWCGASHLGSAKSAIQSQFNLSDFPYYITAGPRNSRWSGSGGRYFRDGASVGKNGHQPDKIIDLSAYSQIVFVGQWIKPARYLAGVKLMSDELLEQVFHENCFVHLPTGVLNEPLSLFPEIMPGRCTLIPDPLPYSAEMAAVPDSYLRFMYSRLSDFCQKKGIRLFMPPAELLQGDRLLTKKEYCRERLRDSNSHCSNDYWKIFFSKIGAELIA